MKLDNFSKYEIYPDEQKVWSYKRNKYLTPKKTKKGYLEYSLYDDNNKRHYIRTHKLFWAAVNGEIPNGYQLNHIDENKENNALTNLNLMTQNENNNWGTRNERAKQTLTNGKRSKVILALKDEKIHLVFPSLRETRRKGFNDGAIYSCIKGRKKHHRGYKWQYLDDYLADWLYEYQMESMKNEMVGN